MMVALSEQLKSRLTKATRVCVLTGAGVSAESGVPTFRDPGGLWQKFRPEELANMNAFLRNPKLVWDWYQHRREVVARVEPNPGHYALAEMERFFDQFVVATQNVDGLHARAGSSRLLELHGNIMRSYCVDCGRFASEDHLARVTEGKVGAVCEACSGLLRPDVVWFGEMLPADVWSAAEQAASTCQLFFSVGTSSEVYPAAGLAMIAKEGGAYVVEVNPKATGVSELVDEVLRGPSAEVMPQIARTLRHS